MKNARNAYEQLVAKSPVAIDYQNSLALAHNNLGALLSRTGQQAGAEAAYLRAIELQTRLVAAVPTLSVYRSDLALTYNNLGSLQTELRRADDAIRSYQRALKLLKGLAAQHPQDIHYQSLLGGIYNNLGIALQEQRQDQQATTAFAAAVAHQRTAYDAAPGTARYRDYLSKHLYNYGRALRNVRRASEAAEAALQRRQLWPADPQRLWAIAEELALAVNVVREDPSQKDWVASHDAKVIQILRESIDAGLNLPKDQDWPTAFAATISRQQAVATEIAQPSFN